MMAPQFKGPVVGLDLGRKTGFAVGRPNEKPRSLTAELAHGRDTRAIACGNLIAFLDAEFRRQRPSLLVKEAPLSLQAFKELNMGEPVVRMTYALHGVAEAVCARWGVHCTEKRDSTVRKHFIGKGRLGTRSATKLAVVSRCWQLGYFPRSIYDEDRADACATWDYGCAHVARIAPTELVLFEEIAA